MNNFDLIAKGEGKWHWLHTGNSADYKMEIYSCTQYCQFMLQGDCLEIKDSNSLQIFVMLEKCINETVGFF